MSYDNFSRAPATEQSDRVMGVFVSTLWWCCQFAIFFRCRPDPHTRQVVENKSNTTIFIKQ